MGKYVRPLLADAEQIQFTEADKESAKKGIPITAYGAHIKHEDGEFSVLIHVGEDAKLAKEGDWFVTEEGGRKLILSDDKFKDIYQEWSEEDIDDNSELNDAGSNGGDTIVLPVITDPPASTEPETPVIANQEPAPDKVGTGDNE